MNINELRNLDPYASKLNALGLSGQDSLEQLIGVTQAAGSVLSDYLEVDFDTFTETMNSISSSASAIPQNTLDMINEATYYLGFAIDQLPREVVAPEVVAPIVTTLTSAAAPASVNLIPSMPPIQNQKSRGTCVAFAALSAYEHYLNTQGAFQDLSEQFLYWNCKRNDSIPNTEGTWLRIAIPLLQRDGCCLESKWDYEPTPIVGNEGQGPPPGGAQLQALNFRSPGYKHLSPTSVNDIKNKLAAGFCVAFSIPVFNSWLGSQWVINTGDITNPIPGEVASGGHAMCFVGYQDLSDLGLGGGRFILRNSWGGTWGVNSQFGSGYGTIPYSYIARLGSEAYSIM